MYIPTVPFTLPEDPPLKREVHTSIEAYRRDFWSPYVAAMCNVWLHLWAARCTFEEVNAMSEALNSVQLTQDTLDAAAVRGLLRRVSENGRIYYELDF